MKESDIIEAFRGSLGISAFDDVGVFESGGGMLAVNTDGMSAGTDIPPGTGLDDAGYRSVASCVSDFAAKGVRPECGVISVTVPRDVSPGDVGLLSGGVARAADAFGIRMIGGDTGEGGEISLHVTLFGHADAIVPRSGARRGDVIYATGSFGYAAAGLRMLLEGTPDAGGFAERAKRAVLRPLPPLDFGVGCRGIATSSMDSSDGLATCLNEMARQSGTLFSVDARPTSPEVVEYAAREGADIDDLVFYGGGEYETVFTAPRGAGGRLAGLAASAGVSVRPIGEVRPGSGVIFEGGGRPYAIEDRGWSHFSRSRGPSGRIP